MLISVSVDRQARTAAFPDADAWLRCLMQRKVPGVTPANRVLECYQDVQRQPGAIDGLISEQAGPSKGSAGARQMATLSVVGGAAKGGDEDEVVESLWGH